jgi:hypothetical protein
MVVHSATQSLDTVQLAVAAALGVPFNKVRSFPACIPPQRWPLPSEEL